MRTGDHVAASGPGQRGGSLRNSYMNAESIRIDAGIRMQPK